MSIDVRLLKILPPFMRGTELDLFLKLIKPLLMSASWRQRFHGATVIKYW